MSSVDLSDIFPMKVINTAERTAGLREFKMNRKVRREHERKVLKSHAKELKDMHDMQKRARKKVPWKPRMGSQRKVSHYSRLCDSVYKCMVWLYAVVAMLLGYIMMPLTVLWVHFSSNEGMEATLKPSDAMNGKQAISSSENTPNKKKSAHKKEAVKIQSATEKTTINKVL